MKGRMRWNPVMCVIGLAWSLQNVYNKIVKIRDGGCSNGNGRSVGDGIADYFKIGTDTGLAIVYAAFLKVSLIDLD